ncbi:hypothetical protein H9I38_09595, partial [Arthrobacter sp. UM1]|nr:hypothetical protein [Arthrobacter sp. UM1]
MPLIDTRRAPARSSAPQKSIGRLAAAGGAVTAVLISTSLPSATALQDSSRSAGSHLFTPRVAPEPAAKKAPTTAARQYAPASAPAQWWRWWNEDHSRTGYYYGTGAELNAFMAAGQTTADSARVQDKLPYVDPSAGRQVWKYWNAKTSVTGLFTGTGEQLNTFLNAWFSGKSMQSALREAHSSPADLTVQRNTAAKPSGTTPTVPSTSATAPKAPAAQSPAPKAPSVPAVPTAPAPQAKAPAAPKAPVQQAPLQKTPAPQAPSAPAAPSAPKAQQTAPAAPAQGQTQAQAPKAPVKTPVSLAPSAQVPNTEAPKSTTSTAPASKNATLSTAVPTSPSSPAAAKTSAQHPYVDADAPAQWWNYWTGGDSKDVKGTFYGTGKQANVFLNAYLGNGDLAAAKALAAKLGPITPPASEKPAASKPAAQQPAPSKAATQPAASKPARTAAYAPASKAYVDASAPAQWWNYWDGNGAKGTYYGTGKQANAYLNALFSTGSKEQAQAAADKIAPAQTPAVQQPAAPKPAQPAAPKPAPSAPASKAYVDASAPAQWWN